MSKLSTSNCKPVNKNFAVWSKNGGRREKEHTELTSQARQEQENLLRTLARREQAVTAQLLALQQRAEQEKARQTRHHSEQAQALKRKLAEPEKEHAELTSHARQELKILLHTLAQREQEVAAQLLAIHQQAAQEKAEQAKRHSEQTQAFHRQHTEREQALNQPAYTVRRTAPP